MKMVKLTEDHYILVDDTHKEMYTIPTSQAKELLGVVDVEKKAFELAILFHNTYEKLAPAFGYETRLDTKVFDKNSANGKLMIAVCKEIYQALEDNKEKKYTRNEVHALMCKAFEQGLKKADVLEAGLEGKETDVECAWILTRHDSTPKKTEWEVEFVDGKLKLKS